MHPTSRQPWGTPPAAFPGAIGPAVIPAILAACLFLRAGMDLLDTTRPKSEPRPPGPIELNETRGTRHELP